MKNKIQKLLLPFFLLFSFNLYAGDNSYYVYKKEMVNYVDSLAWARAPKIDTPDLNKSNYGLLNKFSLLTFAKLNKKTLDLNYDLRLTKDKVTEMQKMASYITDKYEVPLSKAEKIVYEVYKNSAVHNVEPHLILGVIDVESTFQYNPVNKLSSAKGLMQVIARYHPEEVSAIKAKNLELHSVEGSIEAGVLVLSKYLAAQKGNLSRALQAYNGTLHDKSQAYSKKVLGKMSMFAQVSKKPMVNA